MTVHVITWKWGRKYGSHYVERLARGLERNIGSHTFTVCEPLPEDMYLTEIPGCFARLRTFDPIWQKSMGFKEGDRIICLDLDLIVTGKLDEIVNRDEPFVILQGVNAKNPCKMNGSVWMLRAGYRPDVWSEFSVEKAAGITVAEYPDDQRWFEYMIPDAAAYGPATGVYGFCKPGWTTGAALPKNARLVAFFGWRDPSKFTHIPWVAQHWK